MVFADVFEQCQFPDYAAAGCYIAYRDLARTVKKLKHASDPTTPGLLLSQVRKEADRVLAIVNERLDVFKAVAEELRQDCLQQRRGRHEVRARAEALKHEALRFHECRCLNADALMRIADRFRTYSLLPPPPVWDAIRNGAGLLDAPLDPIFYCLSTSYGYARGDDGQSKVSEAIGSQDFVRRSVKYWVHPQDLPFVIALIVPHMPISAVKDLYKPGEPYSLGSAISSVYFDNRQFTMYHKRMRRLEGSSLFRIRWYGDERDVADPNMEVFAELKVHHEAWSGEASTKRRFNLANKDMDAYLVGDLTLTDQSAKMRRKGSSEKDVKKFENLAVEMLTTIVAEELRPALRTEYSRVAFQRGKDQSVRVSIDTNLRIRAEDLGVSKHWQSAPESVDARHKVDFPYAVVEVKLQCAETEVVPAWVEELMTCRYMESVPKFSKYAHGVASLFGGSKYVRLTPYWLHQLNVDIRAATKVDMSGFDAVQGLADSVFHRAVDRAIFGTAPPQAARRDMQVKVAMTGAQLLNTFIAMERGDGATPTETEAAAAELPLELRHDQYMKGRVWAAQQAAAEAGCCGQLRTAESERAFGDIPGQTAKRVKVPQRFDPKTFFTAERYFLRWAESSVMLALGALFILHFGDVGTLPLVGSFWTRRTHVYLGVAMMTVALATVWYALLQFHARSRRVYARVKIRYDDEKGPAALTVATVAGLFAVAAIHVSERFGHLKLF
jgi:SPX domain protein involved in polyphosphate accumulation/uncharacterized membrane protein YidH (DUF202 family)